MGFFVLPRGQKNMLGMLEITEREQRIYSVNDGAGFCAYLCTTTLALALPKDVLRARAQRCKA